MASSGCNGNNLQLNDLIVTFDRKIQSIEHEEIKIDQMAAKKLSSSLEEKPQGVEDFDETQLKNLLDEALDYKSPRDANDKSEIFKQLLKNVTEEDKQRRNEPFNYDRSNSLQNLLDDSHYQLSSHQSHTSSKKHHQRRKNSTSVSARRLEGGSLPIDMHHSSAVQSPPDQPFLSEYKNSQKRKEKQKKETVIDMNENETDEKKLMQRNFDSFKDGISSYPYEGTEMKTIPQSYTSSIDLDIQDSSKYSLSPASITTISSVTVSGGPPASASIINTKLNSPPTTSSSTIHHSVDKLIEFPSLMEHAKSYQQKQQIIPDGSTINHSNNTVLANHSLKFAPSPANNALTLNPGYNAVTSVINEEKTGMKPYTPKTNHEISGGTCIPMTPVVSASHQSTPSMNSKESGKSKPKRTMKSNEKTIDIKGIEGFRGDDELEDLLKYIDGDGKNQKKLPKNGIVSSNQTSDHLLSAEEKKKKMAAKNKEKVNKLKKSNSMDELCSTGRQQQEQQEKSSTSSAAANKIIQDVTLRSKSSNLTSSAKKGDKTERTQPKRNERRSWGTEGLWTEAADASRDNQEENQEVESFSSSSSSGVPSEILSAVVTTVESTAVISETEFHVVTKKRKVKRKSNDGGDSSKTSNHLQSYNMKRDGNIRTGTRHYNDREVSSKNTRNSKPLNQDSKGSSAKNRRKSTSSITPSDDDWHSDGGDSVQSLPIETTKTTSSQLLSTTSVVNEMPSTGGKTKKHQNSSHQQQQQHQKPATFSYADIAKTNANRNSGTNVSTSTEKWPSISASSSTSHQNSNDPFSIANFDAVSSNHSVSNQKSQPKTAPITTSMLSFPELVETNNNKNKQLSSNPSSSSSENASNGEPINTTEKPLNGLDTPRAFDNNNNNNSNVIVVVDDRTNNNQKISYSQSLLEKHQELDSNGNSVKTDVNFVSTNGTIAKAIFTKSKSVDQNNLSSIEHYPALEKTHATLGQVFSKAPVTFETYASKSKQKQIKPDLKDDKKLTKKDKLKKSVSVQNPQYPQQNSILNCRPAVIIVNDSSKSTDRDCEFSFGFDINEHLLCGYQNGDAGMDACMTGVSLENTNNNNNCDIINTNLSSNNNLTKQPSGLEVYESFIASQSIVIGDSHIMAMKSQSSPKQQSCAHDSSNQSSNDIGYLSSSLITNATSPATQKSTSSMTNIDQDEKMAEDFNCEASIIEKKRVGGKMDDCKLLLPQFQSPDPVKFNHAELVSFVSDEWNKATRNGVYFNGQ